jgi:pilus assembly protein CpaC
LTERSADTSVELRAGQTLALAGLIQNRVEAFNVGIPVLGDLPVLGRAFSTVHERMNEVELLILVTPEIVSPLEAHEVPQCGPGQLTTNPSDTDLYLHGYLEVPNCCLEAPPMPAAIPTWQVGHGAVPGVQGEITVPDDLLPTPDRSHRMPTEPPATDNTPPPSADRQAPASVSRPEDRTTAQPRLYGPSGYDPIR